MAELRDIITEHVDQAMMQAVGQNGGWCASYDVRWWMKKRDQAVENIMQAIKSDAER